MSGITYKDGTTYSIVKFDHNANGYLKSDLITLKNFYKISTFTTGESNIIIDKEAVQKFQDEHGMDILLSSTKTPSGVKMLTIKMERLYDYNDKWLEELLLLAHGLKRLGHQLVSLVLPFFPYSRADRFMADRNGPEYTQLPNCEALVNLLRHTFARVYTYDIHNPEVLEHFGNWIVNDTGSVVNDILDFMEEKPESKYFIIVPDKGARKRLVIKSFIEGYKKPVVQNNKTRDVSGKIIASLSTYGPEVEELIKSGNARGIVLDDICDGGATFIELAKSLRTDKLFKDVPFDLYVTHGIFSKGTEELSKYYDRIKSKFTK